MDGSTTVPPIMIAVTVWAGPHGNGSSVYVWHQHPSGFGPHVHGHTFTHPFLAGTGADTALPSHGPVPVGTPYA